MDQDVLLTVIGVAGDVRSQSLAVKPALDVYASHHQTFAGDTFLVVTTAGDPQTLAGSVAAAIRDIDPEQSIFDVRVIDERMAQTVWQQRTAAAVIGGMGVLSLVLAALGVYGVLAYAVIERRREFGVRRAIGASNRDVLGLVIRKGLTPVAVGIGGGSVLALLAVRGLEGLVYGVSTFDPVSLGVAMGALLLAAAAACLVPVQRALRVDPAEALRDA